MTNSNTTPTTIVCFKEEKIFRYSKEQTEAFYHDPVNMKMKYFCRDLSNWQELKDLNLDIEITDNYIDMSYVPNGSLCVLQIIYTPIIKDIPYIRMVYCDGFLTQNYNK